MQGISILFLTLMFVISLHFRKRSDTKEGYFVSSRKLGSITLSFTIAATTIGGSAIVVSLKLIEKYGVTGILMDIAGGIGLIILSLTMAKKVRETGAITLPSILRKSLGKNEYKVISIALIIAEVCWIALSFKGIQIIGRFSNFNLAVISILILTYSLIGGQWAVSKTDIVQFLFVVFGLIFYILNPGKKLAVCLKTPDLSLFYLSTLMLLSHIIGPDIYSKILSAKDPNTAKKGVFLSGLLKIIFAILLILAFKNGFSTSNVNLFVFIVVFSAIVSSIDSMLITSTSIICEDIFEKTGNIVIKLTTVFIALLSFMLAVYTKKILTLVSSGYTVLLVTITFPVLSYFIFRRINFYSYLVPLSAFLIAFIFTKNMGIAFFFSLFGGGLNIVYTKIYS